MACPFRSPPEAQWKGDTLFLLSTLLHCDKNIKRKARSVPQKTHCCVRYSRWEIHYGIDDSEVQRATGDCFKMVKIPL